MRLPSDPCGRVLLQLFSAYYSWDSYDDFVSILVLMLTRKSLFNSNIKITMVLVFFLQPGTVVAMYQPYIEN